MGISTIFIRLLTVPLHSTNSRQLLLVMCKETVKESSSRLEYPKATAFKILDTKNCSLNTLEDLENRHHFADSIFKSIIVFW